MIAAATELCRAVLESHETGLDRDEFKRMKISSWGGRLVLDMRWNDDRSCRFPTNIGSV